MCGEPGFSERDSPRGGAMNYGMQSTSGFVAYAPENVRADFIRRVYSLFFTSLLVTVGVGALCAQPGVAPTLIGMLPVLLIGGFIVGIIMAFTRRTTGVNLGLFYLYSAIQGAIVGPVLVMLERYAPGVGAQAAFLTAAVFGGLSLYALQSKRDFSFLGGFLFVALIGLLVAGIVMFFVHSSAIATLYSFIGVLIFSGYVLYDTSMIMRNLGPDEAVAGAISLYLDFINLFWFILRLLLAFSGNRRD
jgi:FtsH-binding integral membrane protein